MWLLAAAVTALALTPGPILAQSIYEPYAFTTLAGLAGSTGSVDGTGGGARFNYPNGVAVDNAGNVFVADSGNHTIRKVTPAGVVTTLAGLAGSRGTNNGIGSAARFNVPRGLAVDSAGNVHVADAENHTIRKVTPSGVVSTLAGLAANSGSADGTESAARFDWPIGVAVDAAGNTYVADYGNQTIRKVTPMQVVTTLAGLARNPGNTDGAGSTARFSGPCGVAVDGMGNVYVADGYGRTIRKIAPTGVVTTLAGLADKVGSADGTGSDARFAYPSGVAVDGAGDLYVADSGGHTLRKVTPTGVVTTLAGLAGSYSNAEGVGSDARFFNPSGVAVDGAGNLYVADSSNATIRKGLAASTLQFANPYFDVVENAGSISIPVTLAGTHTNMVTVDFATSDGTALAVSDYTATNGTLTFIPGQTTATFTVPILNDRLVEVPETVNLTLSNPTGDAPLGGPTHVVLTIPDNDRLTIDLPGLVNESAGAATVRVTRSGDMDAAITAAYFTSDGLPYDPFECPDCPKPAIAGVDYRQEVGVLTFAPGETNQVFTIPILDNGRVDDYRVDAYRVFTVTVFNDSGFQNRFEVGIQDNETLVQIDQGFNPGISGTLNALALQPDGRILLGGMFDRVADVPCSSLARLEPDGSLDASFVAATIPLGGSLQVSALTLQTNGQILVGGDFTTVDRVTLNSMMRLNADGSLDPGFNSFAGVTFATHVTDPFGNPNVAGINAILAQPNGKIVIGGAFDTVNGVGRTNLARLNVDGSLDTSFVTGTEYPSRVSTLAQQPDGMILVGGTFTTVNGADHYGLARLNPDGSLDNTFFVGDSVAFYDGPGSVNSIVLLPDGFILIAGTFTSVHGVGRNNLARLHSNGGLDMTFDGPLEMGSRVPTIAAAAEGRVWVAKPWCGLACCSCSFTLSRLNPDGLSDGMFLPVQGGGWPFAMAVHSSGDVLLFHGGNDWTGAGLIRVCANPTEPRVGFMATQHPYSTPSSTDLIVNEISGMATVTVQRLGDTSSALVVAYATSDGTARAGLNYVATSGTLSFAPLEVTKMISIPILDDHAFSSDLTFRMTLSHPSVGLLGLNPLTITVRVSNYTPYTFTTLAGLAGSSGSTDGTGSEARFKAPRGVAVDNTGNVYVADAENHTIRKVTAAGVVTTLAGLGGGSGSSDGTASAARFYRPSAVAVDNVGNVYVADRDNHTIRKLSQAGVVTTLAGLAGSSGSRDGTGRAARFNAPRDVAVDSFGNAYVADSFNHTIRKVTAVGVVTTLAGLAGSSGSSDGIGSAARFAGPAGVALDRSGDIYVADSWNCTIRKVTPAGVVTTQAGLAGSSGSQDGTGSAARFNGPIGVAVDNAGNIYVADEENHTVRKVTLAGVVTTLAGMAGNYGGLDGTGSAARFSFPFGVAVDIAGNLYVADTSNHTIRRGFPALGILSSGPSFGFSNGQFGFVLTGPVGYSAVVDASTDLMNWLPIWTNTFTGDLLFRDPHSGAHPHRFYRVQQR